MTDKTKLEPIVSTISSHIYQFHQGAQLKSDELADIINKFKLIYTFDEAEASDILRLLETKYITTMGVGVSLINEEVFHDEEWYLKRKINGHTGKIMNSY